MNNNRKEKKKKELLSGRKRCGGDVGGFRKVKGHLGEFHRGAMAPVHHPLAERVGEWLQSTHRRVVGGQGSQWSFVSFVVP